MRIVWEAPAPRAGWLGSVDRFFGPGATRAEFVLQLVAVAGLSGVALLLTAAAPGARLSTLDWLVLTVLAVDISGGVVTNATAPAKRWYHRRELSFGQQLGFVALHGAHLLLFTGVLNGTGWGGFAICYALLLGTTAVLLWVPLYLQRPLALTFYAGLLMLSLALVPPETGLAWFLPLFFLKIEVSHLVREAPFRPAGHEMEA